MRDQVFPMPVGRQTFLLLVGAEFPLPFAFVPERSLEMSSWTCFAAARRRAAELAVKRGFTSTAESRQEMMSCGSLRSSNKESW
jgi:hypothetical protein